MSLECLDRVFYLALVVRAQIGPQSLAKFSSSKSNFDPLQVFDVLVDVVVVSAACGVSDQLGGMQKEQVFRLFR